MCSVQFILYLWNFFEVKLSSKKLPGGCPVGYFLNWKHSLYLQVPCVSWFCKIIHILNYLLSSMFDCTIGGFIALNILNFSFKYLFLDTILSIFFIAILCRLTPLPTPATSSGFWKGGIRFWVSKFKNSAKGI